MRGYRRFFRLFGRSAADREREAREEIEAHIELRVEDLVSRGVDPGEARRQAVERFGDLEGATGAIESAAGRRDRALSLRERSDDLLRDLRLTWRRSRSAPGYALLSIGIFALGVGLTTSVFTVLDQVLLRPLPYPEPDRLVALWSVEENGSPFAQVSMGNWYDWRAEADGIAATGLFSMTFEGTVSGDGEAFTAPTVGVTAGLFTALNPDFRLGRAFTDAEADGAEPVVVVSEGFWRRVLGADSDLERRTLLLDDVERRIVGVIASGFEHPEGTDVWTPMRARPYSGSARNNINYEAVARLAPGVSLEQAESELGTIAEGIRTSDPDGVYSWGVDVRPLQDVVVGEAQTYLQLLMGAVVLVLLIGCANVAALGFARGADRASEVAVRLSLGAGRGRLFQQLLTEQIVLALVGGVLGIALAAWSVGAAMDGLAQIVPRAEAVRFDRSIALIGIAFSLIAGTIAGLAPAYRVSRGTSTRSLLGGRGVRGGLGAPGVLLVGLEAALTVVLLTGGLLLLRSFVAVTDRELGFDPGDVVTARVTLASGEYRNDPARVTAYWETLLPALSDLPSTEVVGAGNWIPTGGGGASFVGFPDDPESQSGAGYRVVSDEYFNALRIPLLEGRAFDARDRMGGQRVAVVNRTMADEYWPGRSPIGELVSARSMESYFHDGVAPWLTIVGVVGDVRHGGFEADVRPELFVAHRQMPWMTTSMTAVVRLRPNPTTGALRRIQEAARAVDPGLAVDVDFLQLRVRRQLSERRLIVTVLSVFGGVALLLASLGVFGVISFAVGRRAQEMAIRAALGATGGGLIRLVVSGALRIVLIGAAVGLAVAIGSRGVVESLLVDVPPEDIVSYATALVTLICVAAAAALLPAWRASRMDPLEALREQG